MLLILSAMDKEISRITASLNRKKGTDMGGRTFFRGFLEGQELVMGSTGMGPDAEKVCLEALKTFRPDYFIFLGTAGALAPGLVQGDFVAAGKTVCRGGDGLPALEPDRRLLDAALSYDGEERCLEGTVVTSTEVIDNPAVRAELYERYGAHCVDMEGYHAAAAAEEYGVPFLLVRVISDSADSSVSADFLKFIKKASLYTGKILVHVLNKLF